MKKFILTTFVSMITLITNAQSAESAGNNAYANAMIRNVLIIAGIAILYFIYKFSTKKRDKKD